MRFNLARRNIDIDTQGATEARTWLMERIRQEVKLRGEPHPKLILLFTDVRNPNPRPRSDSPEPVGIRCVSRQVDRPSDCHQSSGTGVRAGRRAVTPFRTSAERCSVWRQCASNACTSLHVTWMVE